MKKLLDLLLGILIGLLAAGLLWLVGSPPRGREVALLPAPTPRPVVVHVSGAVPRPGVYALPAGSRVQDALRAAGGFLSDADPAAVNLAALLEDGSQLVIPEKTLVETIAIGSPGGGTLVDINKATLAELDTLPGIGPTTATRIIEYRQQNGPFKELDDLMDVPGIGPATFDRIKNMITIGH